MKILCVPVMWIKNMLNKALYYLLTGVYRTKSHLSYRLNKQFFYKHTQLYGLIITYITYIDKHKSSHMLLNTQNNKLDRYIEQLNFVLDFCQHKQIFKRKNFLMHQLF